MLCLCVICSYISIHLCVGECECSQCVPSIHAMCTLHCTVHIILNSLIKSVQNYTNPANNDRDQILDYVYFVFKVFLVLSTRLVGRSIPPDQIRQENYNHLSNCRWVFCSKNCYCYFATASKSDRS